MTTHRRSRATGERGAALVEFALIFPIFMTLVLGMFSGGIAYNQDLSITHSAREGSRYAATLAKLPGGITAAAWTAAVRDRVVEAATDGLDLTKTGHYVCVALVGSDGTTVVLEPPAPVGTKAPYNAVFGNPPAPAPPANCYADGLSDAVSRVHVLVGRPGRIEALLFKRDLKLTSKGTARYEP